MFTHSYFPLVYFAGRYFPPAIGVTPPVIGLGLPGLVGGVAGGVIFDMEFGYFDQIIVFPDWAFGAPPRLTPVIQTIALGGSASANTILLGGTADMGSWDGCL